HSHPSGPGEPPRPRPLPRAAVSRTHPDSRLQGNGIPARLLRSAPAPNNGQHPRVSPVPPFWFRRTPESPAPDIPRLLPASGSRTAVSPAEFGLRDGPAGSAVPSPSANPGPFRSMVDRDPPSALHSTRAPSQFPGPAPPSGFGDVQQPGSP